MGHRLHRLQLVVVQREITTLDGTVACVCKNAHILQLANHIRRFVAGERAGIQTVTTVSMHQPRSLRLVMSSVGRCGEADQEGLRRPPPARHAQILHDGREGRRDGAMGLVEHDEVDVVQKPVSAEPVRQLGAERLNRRDDDMEVAGRNRLRLPSPHPGNAQALPSTANTGPDLPPCFHGLLAQFVAVRHPEDIAVEAIPHSLDNGLDGDPSLARTGGQADHSAPVTVGGVPVEEHVPCLVDDGPLVDVQWRKPTRPFHFHKRRAA